MELGDLIIYTASVVTAVVTVGSALLWVYKKIVIEPAQKNDKKMYEKSSRELKDTIQPLSRSIDTLSNILDDSVKDRKQLNKRVGDHDEILVDHDKRITILEINKPGR